MVFLEIILLAYTVYFVSYAFVFAVGGLFYKRKTFEKSDSFKKIAVFIPGYKEDAIIVDSVSKNLSVDYPKEAFEIVVLADSFEASTLASLRKLPINLMEVSFDKSTKVKSLKEGLKRLGGDFEYIVVLDADNIMEPDYLKKINQLLQSGNYSAVQTQRVPKNNNTTMAILDGISEAINNHIYRQGSHSLGMSVALNGSGMVFEKNQFTELINQMDSVGGFDRELEYKYLEKGISVKYFREAEVFDEKIDNHNNFKNQRKRWISSQYVYLARYFWRGVKGLFTGKLSYFHSTVWRNIQLPRLINLGLLTMLTLLALIFQNHLNFSYLNWIGLWSLNTLALLISIPRKFYNKDMIRSVILLPKIFFSMFLLMFKLKGANKKFIHTEHKAV